MMVRDSGSDDDEELLATGLDHYYDTVREMEGTRDWW